MRILIYALIGIAAVTTAITLTGPNVDLVLASLFYDPETAHFPAWSIIFIGRHRYHSVIAIVICFVCIGLFLTRYLPWRLPTLPGRPVLCLTLSLVVGPGILVNLILKDHWGRPRPVQVTMFGGTRDYVDWWNPTGTCPRNCSFVSGEVAAAAWTIGPAFLVPPPWRAVAVGAAITFTVAMSVIRMAAGGHFFTDTVFSALATLLVLLAICSLMRRWPVPGGKYGWLLDEGVNSPT